MLSTLGDRNNKRYIFLKGMFNFSITDGTASSKNKWNRSFKADLAGHFHSKLVSHLLYLLYRIKEINSFRRKVSKHVFILFETQHGIIAKRKRWKRSSPSGGTCCHPE